MDDRDVRAKIICVSFGAGAVYVSLVPEDGGPYIQQSWWIGNSWHIKNAAGLGDRDPFEAAKGKTVLAHYNFRGEVEKLLPLGANE